MFEATLVRILIGFAFLVFFVVGGFGVYLVVLSEVKERAPVPLRMKVVWGIGFVVIAGSLGTVLVMAMLALGRMVGG